MSFDQSEIAAPVTRGLEPVRRVLENGATIIAKESRATPAVTVHASLRAGTVYDPPAIAGLSHFVSRTVDRGTAGRSADDIAELLDSRGVSLTVMVNRHAMSLVSTCLVEDYPVVMSLVAEILRSAEQPRTTDSVGRKLRHGRSRLLRLHRGQRRTDSRTRPAGRFPCEPDL